MVVGNGHAPKTMLLGRRTEKQQIPCIYFGAFCMDVRTLTFCQLKGFSIKPLKVKLLAGEQKATEYTVRIHMQS